MRLKVVAYNILRGLHSIDKQEGFARMDPVRMDAAQTVVRELNPDVLMLTEVCKPGWNNHGIAIDYKALFGIQYQVECGPIADSHHGNAILSRMPLTPRRNCSVSRFKHVGASLSLEGKTVTLDLIHPHVKLSECERARLLRTVVEGSGERYLLAGDFNSYSPDDSYDEVALERTYNLFSDSSAEAKAFVADLMTRQTVKAAKSYGLIDSYRALNRGVQHRTVPTNLRKDGDAGARMDYIFCSPDVNIVDSGIYTKAPASVASDHFPVWATLDF